MQEANELAERKEYKKGLKLLGERDNKQKNLFLESIDIIEKLSVIACSNEAKARKLVSLAKGFAEADDIVNLLRSVKLLLNDLEPEFIQSSPELASLQLSLENRK